jgi:hypothetical protein
VPGTFRSFWLGITSIHSQTGQLGQPIGLTGKPSGAVFARGSMWVTGGGNVVDRVWLAPVRRYRLPRLDGR